MEGSDLNNRKKPHRCLHNGCNFAFDRPYKLAQHLLVHENVKIFSCHEDNCMKSYTNKSHLDRHIKNVHKNPDNDLVYSCPTCLKRYANRQNLKRHINIHHKLKVQFSCDTCKLEFKKKHHLSAHMYGHTGIKAFSCELCSEEFVSLIEKKRHSRYHKTYQCVHCTVKFSQWSKYQKHLKTEHKTKEFHCDECGRNFKQRSHILRHIKTHGINAKMFQCPFQNCKKLYSRKTNLRQHIQIKHEHVKHECKICNAQLSTKAKLKEHLLKMHEKSEPKIRNKSVGRKLRKDIGTFKISMALKLAGLNRVPDVVSGEGDETPELQV